jgi:hypothetical protein
MIFIYFGKLTVTEGREESEDKEKFHGQSILWLGYDVKSIILFFLYKIVTIQPKIHALLLECEKL